MRMWFVYLVGNPLFPYPSHAYFLSFFFLVLRMFSSFSGRIVLILRRIGSLSRGSGLESPTTP